MLPKERVAAVFEHRPTDKVPIYQGGLSSRSASIILGREAYVGGGIQQYREARALWEGPDAHQEFLERTRQDTFDLVRTLELDLVRPSYWRMPEKPTRRIDENTFFYGQEDGVWRVMRFDPAYELYQEIDHSPRPELTLEELEHCVAAAEKAAAEAPPPKPENYPDLLAAIAEFGETHAIPGSGIGICVPREPVWLEAIALRPDLVGRYLMAQATRAARVPAVMAQMGLRYLMGGGDFASKNGPFYSPRSFHQNWLENLS